MKGNKMIMTLNVRGLVEADGFLASTYPAQIVIEILPQGKIADPHTGLEYRLSDDGLIDWLGREFELSRASRARIIVEVN